MKMAKEKSKKLYFAYGSCMDYQGRITTEGYANDFTFLGIACLEGYEFRLNKISLNQMHAFANIQKLKSSSVYGYIYEIGGKAERYLDKREGYPTHYGKYSVTVTMEGATYENVITYIAKPEHICPVQLPITSIYYHELYRGCEKLPEPYRTDLKNLLEQCYYNQLYHYSGEVTPFIHTNREFYTVVKDMTLTMGNDNKIVEQMNITPEMFRIMVKLTEMAFRNELDLGHMIPRELLKKLKDDFEERRKAR